MQRKLGLLALAAITLATTTSFDASAGERRMFGKRFPFAVEGLPPGRLRHSLEDLTPKARERALKWLHHFDFPASDTINSLRVDQEGSVLYVDAAPAYVPAAAPPAPASAGAPVSVTTADAFKLHSKPGAARTLYLDFDGHVITGTVWNASYGANLPYDAVPYDTDGVLATFSNTELQSIINIWRRVAEDFAPFDVDVTTEAPATFTTNVGRALITRDYDRNGRAMPAQGAGGVAYVGVFGYTYYGYYSPALIYANRLGGGREDYVSEAVSHELGHNMGLSHDATSTSSYYGGHGAGATSWGPIMGVGYGQAVTEWSRGEYPGASNQEDDVAIVTGKLGARLDEHADTNTGATPLIISSTGAVTSTTSVTDIGNARPENKGIIGSRTDVDVFTFRAASGPLSLTITPNRMPVNTLGGNLDIRADLISQGGALVATSAPNGETAATINTSIGAGTYFLQISGVGDAVTPYSDYGSMGQYNIAGTVPVATVNTVPPSPNPMAFEVAPNSGVIGSIAMRATVATDDAGAAVQYKFECVSGGAGCLSTGWLDTRDYTAAGLTPSQTYSYRVKARDIFGNETAPSAAVAVVVKAPPPNRLPVAVNDSFTIRRFTTTNLPVLGNDSDPDGDKLQITLVSKPTKGVVTFTSTDVTYVPSRQGIGLDSFTYTISDGRGGSAVGTVTVNISR